MNDRYLDTAARLNLISPAYADELRAWARGHANASIDIRRALLDRGTITPEKDAAILQACARVDGPRVERGATQPPARVHQTHGETFSNQPTAAHADEAGHHHHGEGAPADTVDMRGRFTPVRMLGRGGMGLVVLHRDARLLREVAVKQLTRVDAPFAAERFIVEAQVTGQLEHPNIVPVYELDECASGRPALVMRCVRGRHLQSIVSDIARGVRLPEDLVGDAAVTTVDAPPTERERGRMGTRGRASARSNRQRARASAPSTATASASTATLSPMHTLPRLLEVFDKVCDAIAYAHARGVVHRDLKPENIMIGRFGEVLVMDWGLAKELGGDTAPAGGRRWGKRDLNQTAAVGAQEPVRTLRASHQGNAELMATVDGTVAGTPMYMSPEQAEGRTEAVDRRSDIYALGAILYTILTANAPFDADNVYQLLAQVSRGEVKPPRNRNCAPWRIPLELEAIALKAMAHEPAARYHGVTDLQHDLRAYRASLPIRARRDGPLRAIVKWAKRHPAMALSAGVATAFSLVLTLVIAVAIGRTAEADARADAVAAQLKAEAAQREAAQAEAREADLIAEQADLRAERARLAEYALRGEVDTLVSELGGKLATEFERRVEELLQQRARAVADGMTDEAFLDSLGAERLQAILDDFQRLFDAHDRYPDRITVEARHYFYRGLIRHIALRQPRAALDDFTRALKLDPSAVQALNNRGLVLMDLGEFERALQDFERVVDLAPTTNAYLHRATALSELNRLPEAIADVDAALELNRNDFDGIAFRAKLKLQIGRFDEALADTERAIALRDDEPFVHLTRGIALQSLGRDAEAIGAYSRVIELDDQHQVAFANRAAAHITLGQFDDAQADAEIAVRLNPRDPVALLNRAHVRVINEQYDGALADYTAILTVEPRNAKALNNRGYVYALLSRYEDALVDYELLTRVAPRNYEAWTSYGVMLAELDRRDDARVAFEQAMRLAPPAKHADIERRRRTALGE